MRQRPWAFCLLALIVVLAGVCSVTVQYAMKRIVDAMALGAGASVQVWWAPGLFLAITPIRMDELLSARGPLRAPWDLQVGHGDLGGQDSVQPVPASA